jgi:hypothetical protein
MGGVRLGPRRLAALVVALAGAVLFSLLAALLGTDWGGVALAGLAGGIVASLGVVLLELRHLRRWARRSEAATREQVRQLQATRVQAVWEYSRRGLANEPDTFVLYRIIGNDLPPRHRSGQTLENLRFILTHEPALPGCQKRWVVNRIADSVVEKQVVSLLEEHGMPYLHIPFDMDEYRRVGWRFGGFPVPGFTYRREFDEYSPMQQQWALDHLYHDKNLYVMNNNGARNAALQEGRTLAKWVLPWDGNCFLTREAWDELVAAVTAKPYLKYFTVPMARIIDNEVLLRPDPKVEPSEEPQLLFRRDAREQFDPDARYGRCPKVELFWRLGIVGPWDRWCRGPWDPVRARLSTEAGQVGEAGWVARLYSGEKQLERDIEGRGWRRSEAVRTYIDRIDERLAARTFDAAAPVTLDPAILDRQREAWRSGEPGPSRLVGQLIEAAERTDDVTVAALAFLVTREARLSLAAADLLRTRYGAGRLSPRAAHARTLHHLLDAVRLLEREEAFAPAEAERLRAWLAEHRSWLQDSDARAALDHRGTWYDVEVAAIDAYLGDLPGLLATLRRVHERVGQQFDVDGVQREEVSPDGCVHNLHGWVTLAGFAARVGQDLWRSLPAALQWMGELAGDGVDRARLAVLAHEAAGAAPALLESLDPADRDPYQVTQVFSEQDGIRPFWTLGLRQAPEARNPDG